MVAFLLARVVVLRFYDMQVLSYLCDALKLCFVHEVVQSSAAIAGLWQAEMASIRYRLLVESVGVKTK